MVTLRRIAECASEYADYFEALSTATDLEFGNEDTLLRVADQKTVADEIREHLHRPSLMRSHYP